MTEYADIALNGFVAHLAIPYGSETVIYAMQAFGAEGLWPAAAAAWVGAMAAYLLNYAAGRLIARMRIEAGKSETSYIKAQGLMRDWLAWGLLLAGQPLVSALALASGVFAISWKRVMVLSMAGHAARYAWLVIA